jgi:hypothetical protein
VKTDLPEIHLQFLVPSRCKLREQQVQDDEALTHGLFLWFLGMALLLQEGLWLWHSEMVDALQTSSLRLSSFEISRSELWRFVVE